MLSAERMIKLDDLQLVLFHIYSDMMAESWINGMNTCGHYRQCCRKHVSAAAVEDAVFSVWPIPVLHNEDQLGKI
jgi:hypothetical protein